ncbi:hypothetical protein PLICRDRAFT_42457 [Plicaturopsis crispa FD-325 SS-3]|nr:hypothetical protein PLICRDRAFT_42457 [Plicaturopsis crispa FD-325 SS-3]
MHFSRSRCCLVGHLPHTYLDDLESIFYLYEALGKHVAKRPPFLGNWETLPAEIAAGIKFALFLTRSAHADHCAGGQSKRNMDRRGSCRTSRDV